jgi:lipopolysaccharide/colanic/teichoic acid biosynthesis glycosyltransferase
MLRRLVDILFSLVALIALSPLLLAIAVAVLIDSPGNPLYRPWRIGLHGRPFRMWKFRSMVVNADRLGPVITGHGDARVTRLGRLLRRTKLDELPQLVNLLLSDMTLVGPRPEAPEIVARYSESQRAVLAHKPGLTGCVQIEVACEADIIPDGEPAEEYYLRHLLDGKIRRDLEYLSKRTLMSDARVVAATITLVLRAAAHR